MLKDKVLALVKSLPQRPRSRLVPLPEFADASSSQTARLRARASLIDALLKAVRDADQLDVQARRLQARACCRRTCS